MADHSILDYKISPFRQVVVVLGLIFLFIVVSNIVDISGENTENDTPWLIACSFTLFYIIFNSIYSLTADNQNRYWLHSVLGFIILAVGGVGMAYIFSDVSDDSIAIYRKIYIVFVMVYVLLLSIMRFIRRLVHLAQNDTSHIIIKRK